MLKWLKNRLSRDTQVDDIESESGTESDAEEETENFSPVGVRVRAADVATLKPADTHVPGYSVNEGGQDTDDEHSTTVNDIRTTGVDPYNSGGTD
jgi:hypothetical protein